MSFVSQIWYLKWLHKLKNPFIGFGMYHKVREPLRFDPTIEKEILVYPRFLKSSYFYYDAECVSYISIKLYCLQQDQAEIIIQNLINRVLML